MTKQIQKKEFHNQLLLSKMALKSNNFEVSFYHLENAHILGQKHIYRHTVSHYWMLIFGLKTKNYKETIGQFFRIIASIIFTLIWVPTGNTGGTNISPLKPIPIREELEKFLLN